MKVLAALVLLWSIALAHGAPTRELLECELGNRQRIALVAEARGLEGSALFLKIAGRVEKAFGDFPDFEFIGDVVLSKCLDHVMIFAMNYGPPYRKGEVIRTNWQTQEIERINFAEKALPKWVYSGVRDMLVVFPNAGHEAKGAFIVYRFVSGTGPVESVDYVDRLPSRAGYVVTKID